MEATITFGNNTHWALASVTPNPSIERTAESQLRWLSSAAHVER